MYVILALGVAAAASLAVNWNGDEAKAAAAEMELRTEFQSISALPQAIPSDCDSWHKPDSAIVQCVYETGASYEEIRQHYDSELAAHGWQFAGEEPVVFAGRDYGGKTVRYRKTRFFATLEYAGTKSGWNYALSLTWRVSEEGQR